MRDLLDFELESVSGAGNSPAPPCGCYCPPATKQKGNNGYGNGGNDPAPGNSAGKGRDGQEKTDDIVR